MKTLSLVSAILAFTLWSCGGGEAAQGSSSSEITTAFEVSGNCGMCKEKIEKAASEVEGVVSAEWNKTSKQLKIVHDSTTSIKKVHLAVADAGYASEGFEVADSVYDALPACCKYNDTDPH